MVNLSASKLSREAKLVLRDVDRLIQAYACANKKPKEILLTTSAFTTLNRSLIKDQQSLTTHSYRYFPLVHYRY